MLVWILQVGELCFGAFLVLPLSLSLPLFFIELLFTCLVVPKFLRFGAIPRETGECTCARDAGSAGEA